MSIFANEHEGVGARIGPDTSTTGTEGFAALGKPVPFYRREAGSQALKDMGVERAEDRFRVLEKDV